MQPGKGGVGFRRKADSPFSWLSLPRETPLSEKTQGCTKLPPCQFVCPRTGRLPPRRLGFAREASADLPSGDTSLQEVVKDAPSLPDGRLLRLCAAGRGSRSESVLGRADKGQKRRQLLASFYLLRSFPIAFFGSSSSVIESSLICSAIGSPRFISFT